MEDEEWDKLVDINLSAVFRVSKAAARRMIEQGEGGAIVHISSIAHSNGGANLAYGSAKGGVVTLTCDAVSDITRATQLESWEYGGFSTAAG